MQAIETKYFGPSNIRGSRIKASCERGSVTVSYPDELNQEEAHIYAAQALINKFLTEDQGKYGTPPAKNPWNIRRYVGGTKAGYAHVFAS